MRLEELKLHHFTPRGLNMLGHVFGGGDVRVVLSERAVQPLTILLESRTIVLDPRLTGVFDLALGVRLMKHRRLRADLEQSEAAILKHDRKLTARVRKTLARDCREQLELEFPPIRRLSGLYQHPRPNFDGLTVTTRTIRFNPMHVPNSKSRPGSKAPVAISTTGIGFSAIPGIDINGIDDDFSWLKDGLSSGAIPLHHFPQLEELPYVRIPFRTCDPSHFPAMEWLEEHVASEHNQEMVRGFMDCIQSKTEVRDERTKSGRRTTVGTHLDTSRVVEAVVGARTGAMPRIFRRKASMIEPVFDPSEHVAIIAIDLTDAWQNPDSLTGFVTVLATAYQRLDVEIAIVGYAGRLLQLTNDTVVYLHFVSEIKRANEPWEDAIWGRLVNSVRHPLRLPGEPAYFHPAGLEDIAQTLKDLEKGQPHSYATILWSARRWMREAPFNSPEFVARVADQIDHQMANLKQAFTGTLDTLASYLPQRLLDHGRPGEYLASIEIPGQHDD